MSFLKTKFGFIRSNLVLKILIAIFVLTWPPVLAILTYSTYVTRQSFFEHIGQYYFSSLSNYATAVDQKLISLQNEVAQTSSQAEVINYLNQPNSTNLSKLNNALKNNSLQSAPWESMYVTDANGKIIATAEQSNRVVGESIFLQDENGAVFRNLRDTNSVMADIPVSDRDSTGKVAVLKAINSPAIGRPLGYIAAIYSLRNIGQLAKSNSGDGLIIYNSESVPVFSSGKTYSGEDLSQINQKFLDNQNNNNSKVIQVNDKTGIIVLPAFDAGNIAKLKLRVVGVLDTHSLLQDIEDFRSRVFVTTLAVLFVVDIILFIYLKRLITDPLNDIKKTAQQIAAGRYKERVAVSDRSDVIGRLGFAVNDMAMSLVNEHFNLERKVESQTKQLSEKISDLEKAKTASVNLLDDLTTAKSELEKTKNKDEALLSSIGDGVFALDADKRIILFNKAASDITGFSESDTIGKRYDEVLQFIIKNDDIKSPGFIEKSLAGKAASMQKTTYVKHKNGRLIPVNDSASPVIENGKTVGAIVVFRDITEELATDLAKTEFVSLASHQLKTPLTAISWYSEILLKDKNKALKPSQKKYLSEIAEGNKRMVELVNSLLNVSRLELGTVAINPQKTNLVKLITTIETEFKHIVEHQKQTFSIDIPKDLVEVNTDPQLLRIVIQNLVSNAVKYSPQHGKIELSVQQFTKGKVVAGKKVGKNHVLISVKDNGYGIPIKDQDKIFGKLFRADNVKMKNTDGTGLGLYLAKLLASKLKYKLWFTSKNNVGTTFYLSVPINAGIEKAGLKELEQTKSILG